jgi:hypothetical protein
MSRISRREAIQVIASASLATILPGASPASEQPIFTEVAPQQPGTSHGAETVPAISDTPSRPPFKVPGKKYAATINLFVHEFKRHWSKGVPYPISRLFDLFPFRLDNSATARALMKRGTITFTSDEASNDGDYVEATFDDATLAAINVAFDEHMAVLLSGDADKLHFDFTKHPVSLDLPGLAKYQVYSTQKLLRIDFTPTVVSYHLASEKQNPTQQIQIDVDLSKDDKEERHISGLVPTFAMASNLFQDLPKEGDPHIGPFKCSCCGGGGSAGALGSANNPYELWPQCIVYGKNPNWTGAVTAYFSGRTFGIIPDNFRQHYLYNKNVKCTHVTGDCGFVSQITESAPSAEFVVKNIFYSGTYTLISNWEDNP